MSDSIAQKYAAYSTRLIDHPSMPFSYRPAESDPFKTVKVLALIDRVPARKEFVGILLGGITGEERAEAEAYLASMPLGGWSQTRLWRRTTRKSGSLIVFTHAWGVSVDDPLVQLELEAIIDLETQRRTAVAA